MLLPTIEAVIRIRSFILTQSRYEFGYVSHAAAAGLKAILRELDILIAQLENQMLTSRLSIQKMMYLLQPTITTIKILNNIVTRCSNLSGGALLDALHSLVSQQGDEKALTITTHLLQQAAEPFLTMLIKWIYHGELSDPYAEFMIQEDLSLSKDTLEQDFNAQYWENRYCNNSL